MKQLPIALQLYTLRDETEKDFAGTLRAVAKIGYTGVELAGYGGLSVRALKNLLSENGLHVAGSHVAIERLESELDQVIDENLELGNPNVVIPYLAEDRRQTAADYQRVAASLNGWSATLASHGLTLAYHNHAFEFDTLDNGRTGMDILFAETNPALVKVEVDTYWVLAAGHDPVQYLKRSAGRVVLVHLKDRDPADGSYTEIGTGDLPLAGLVDVAAAVGSTWLIVEQDVCRRPPLESVEISFANLKARGYA